MTSWPDFSLIWGVIAAAPIGLLARSLEWRATRCRTCPWSIVVDHLLVGVVGSFQPDKLARAFAGDEDGMYGRFLYAWPSAPDYRPLSNEADEVEPELQNALTALIRLPAEDADGVFAPQSIWLSDGAIAEFEQFRQFVDQDEARARWPRAALVRQRRDHGAAPCRHAGIYGVGDRVSNASTDGLNGITGALEPKTIDEQFMGSAIRLWSEFFWPHARAVLRQIGLSDRHKNARLALRWIKVHGKEEVSREDIRREALGQKLDAEETQKLLDSLEKAGWVRKDTTKTAGRPRHRWEINPQIVSRSPCGNCGNCGKGVSIGLEPILRPVFAHFAHFPHPRRLET